MEITFLGTGDPLGMPCLTCKCDFCTAAKENPEKERLRPSILVKEDGKNYLFDCSPDFRLQMLRNEIDKLDAIFITHCHFDHLLGIFDLSVTSYLKQKRIPVYLSNACMEFVKETHPWIDVDLISFNSSQALHFGSLTIIPIKVEHTSLADTHGFAVQSKGKKLIYLPDFRSLPEKDSDLLKDSNAAVLDGQYILGKYLDDDDHLGGPELIRQIQRISPSEIYLMAVSEHWMKKTEEEILSQLPKNFHIPRDQQTVKL
ncbi:MAG: MBL fold metallo-hydrolase [Candidatus Aenigmarchaeota archaeon]|nr:MBL fold metallo-hydrolase [Candidatus Aenigmarchaeota archaeon]